QLLPHAAPPVPDRSAVHRHMGAGHQHRRARLRRQRSVEPTAPRGGRRTVARPTGLDDAHGATAGAPLAALPGYLVPAHSYPDNPTRLTSARPDAVLPAAPGHPRRAEYAALTDGLVLPSLSGRAVHGPDDGLGATIRLPPK